MLIILLASIAVMLCMLDTATTLLVLNYGAGYESNVAIATFAANIYFHIIKWAVTIVLILGIHYFCKNHRNLEIISYASLDLFYAIVVLNNVLVLVAGIDFGLDIFKMYALFGAIFAGLYTVIEGMPIKHFG